jgi:glycosyltransferase involved in cell wall biosynthesis
LPALYQEAAVFCYPSLNEGFGLPPLEAMAGGVPVVTSNLSSLPEVVGDAGAQVDPRSAEAIAAAIRRLLGTAEGRELGEAGRRRAAGFTWKAAAQQTLAAYEEVLARPRGARR